MLTDFGDRDNFVGVMKGVILKINPRANIVDLCHNVRPQDVGQAAFMLKNSFRYFPKGTVHLAVVDPGVGSSRKAILVKTKDYYFVGPDNGLLHPSLGCEDIEGVVHITQEKYFLKPVSRTFHGRDVFAPVAARVSLGEDIRAFGRSIAGIKRLELAEPEISRDKLTGRVVYIDGFGNLVTNISEASFKSFAGSSGFRIAVGGQSLRRVSASYEEAAKGRLLAVFGSFGNLEISKAKGSAEKALSAGYGTQVRVTRITHKTR